MPLIVDPTGIFKRRLTAIATFSEAAMELGIDPVPILQKRFPLVKIIRITRENRPPEHSGLVILIKMEMADTRRPYTDSVKLLDMTDFKYDSTKPVNKLPVIAEWRRETG